MGKVWSIVKQQTSEDELREGLRQTRILLLEKPEKLGAGAMVRLVRALSSLAKDLG